MKQYLLALVLSGCATESTTRESADYIIEAILAPHCARGGCHSTETQPHQLAFDTISAGKAAMKAVDRRGAIVTPFSANSSELYVVLVTSQGIMPPDAPLAQADIDLIKQWIDDGAEGLE